MRRFIRLAVVAVLGLGLVAGAAAAQTFPVKPIRIIVTFPPGGQTDVVARAMQPYLEKHLGQPVIIDNRPGAGGTIGVDAVAKAPPDGHLLGVGPMGALTVGLQEKLPYDTLKDLVPVSMLTTTPFVMAAPLSSKAKHAADVIAFAKAKSGEPVDRPWRQRLRHAPHRAPVQPHGRRRHPARAVSRLGAGVRRRGGRPHPARRRRHHGGAGGDPLRPGEGARRLLAQARSVAAGRADLRGSRACPATRRWAGSAWSRRPARRRRSSRSSTRRWWAALKDPVVAGRMRAVGAEPHPTTQEEFAQFIRREIDKWGTVVKQAGLKGN